MFIHITPDELEEEFRESWKLGFIKHPSIDYADNAIWAEFENRVVIIFRFKTCNTCTSRLFISNHR